MGGWNSGSCRVTPSMFWQWRILNRAVLDGVPVAEQLVVGREAEVPGGVYGRDLFEVGDVGLELVGVPLLAFAQPVLELDDGVRKGVEAIVGLELVEGLGNDVLLGETRRTVTEDLPGEDVELGGLVDGLHGVATEEVVAPLDDVVEVLHDGGTSVGTGTDASEEVGIEGIVAPLEDLLGEAGRGLVLVLLGALVTEHGEQVVLGAGFGLLEEGADLPEARLWVSEDLTGRLHGMEDEVEPGEGVLEASLASKPVGDEERDVEEELPVVVGVGRAVDEVEVVDGVLLEDGVGGGVRIEHVVGGDELSAPEVGDEGSVQTGKSTEGDALGGLGGVGGERSCRSETLGRGCPCRLRRRRRWSRRPCRR